MPDTAIHREVLPNGLRLVTERMPHVRSVSIGVWLTRGSRHEPVGARRHRALRRAHALQGHDARARPKTSPSRSTRSAATSTPSPRRNTPATSSRCSTSICRWPSTCCRISSPRRPSTPTRSSARRRSSSKRSRWSRTRPTISSTRSSPARFWPDHPLGRPILGQPDTVVGARPATRCGAISPTPTWRRNFVVAAVGNLEHARVRELVERAFAARRRRGLGDRRHRARHRRRRACCAPRTSSRATSASARPAWPHGDPDRYVAFALNTMLGGSMSSRLFQNVREKRGLAYSVFSSLSAYRDAGAADDLRRLRQRRGARAGRRGGRRAAAA